MAGGRDRSVPRTELLSSAARTRVVPHALVALRAAIAIGIAAGLTVLGTAQLPRTLDVSTDVVGYPIHSNFDVNRYLLVYALWVLFFPLAALGLDLALARLTRVRLPRAEGTREPRPAANTDPSEGGIPVVAAIRTAFVGTVLGLEVAVAQELDGASFLLLALVVVLLFGGVAAAVAAFAAGLRRRTLTFWERLATVNVFAAPLTVLGLYDVSRATEMKVLDSGNVYEYPWFPLWLAVLLTGVLLAVGVWEVRRAETGARLRSLERRSLLLVAAPVLLVLLLARLPGEIGPLDFFHEGEPMAAAALTADGAVPWRDLMFIHGLLHDVVSPWLGFAIFEESRWGHYAGVVMIVVPFYWISQYFLFVYLFGRNVIFLLGTQVAVVLGWNRDVHVRYALMPFALLLLAAVLRKPTWVRAGALAFVLAGQAVVSPETSVAIPAFLAALGLFELYSYDRARPLLENFRRTVRTIVSGLVALLLLVAVFAALRLLDDFVFFYRTFFSDHALTGGIPIAWLGDRFYFMAIAPVVLVILAIWFFATARRTRRAPAIDDWVMAGLALTLLLYYPKFLGRADMHVTQVFAVAVPLLAYALYRVLGLLHGRRIRVGGGWVPLLPWVTGLAVVVVALHSPAPILDTAEAVPGRVSAEAHFEQVPPRLGFLSPNGTDLKMIEDVQRVLDAYLEPDDSVFDLSNNPLLFHYLLDRKPSTRYFHVSMAIREHTQSDLVEQLKRRRPKLVVFSSSTVFGLPMWDGITNQVRHYDVSEHVLDHYRPLLLTHGFLIMRRDDADLRLEPALASRLAERPGTGELYFQTLPCDWGYAPNFLKPGPSERDSSAGAAVTLRPAEGVAVVTGWAADLEARMPAVEIVAALGRRVFAQTVPSTERPEIAGGLQDQGFLLSGFRMVVPGAAPLQELRFYGLTRAGTARELIYGPDSGLAPTSGRPDRIIVLGRSYPVVRGGIHGWAETVIPEKRTLAFELPSGKTPADYDWVEIRTKSRLTDDALGITDTRAEYGRTISFRTLNRGRSAVHVHVGACSQWQGFPRELYLESALGQEISSVRLVP